MTGGYSPWVKFNAHTWVVSNARRHNSLTDLQAMTLRDDGSGRKGGFHPLSSENSGVPVGRHSLHRVTLQLSLSSAFSAIVLLTSLCLGVALYSVMSDSVRAAMRERLQTALGVASVGFDINTHERIRQTTDEATPAYREMTTQLRQVRDRVAGVRYVYTYRRLDDGKFVFGLDAEDDPKLKSHVGQVMREEDITPLMRTVLHSNRVEVEQELTSDIYGVWLSGYVPLKSSEGQVVAVLGMDISAADVLSQEHSFLVRLAAICGVIALLVLPIGLFIARSISRPLTELAHDMGRIRQFELNDSVQVVSRIVEVAKIADAVQGMKSGLRSFRKYVPADLVRQLIRLGRDAELGGELRDVTVFFSDIKSFTSIAEQTAPDLLVKRLGEYFGQMNEAILGERGTIDKYIGDAVMAFWGAPEPIDEAALRACRAALACQATTLEPAVAENGEASGFRFETRIGLCCGEAIVGNMGSADRLNYTAIGDVVNTASRLESACKYYGVRILISDSVRRQAGDAIVARALDLVAVKGKNIPLRVHELVGLADSTPATIAECMQRHDAAFAHYASGAFDEASAAFAALAEADPQDQAVARLLERSRELLATHATDPVRILADK